VCDQVRSDTGAQADVARDVMARLLDSVAHAGVTMYLDESCWCQGWKIMIFSKNNKNIKNSRFFFDIFDIFNIYQAFAHVVLTVSTAVLLLSLLGS